MPHGPDLAVMTRDFDAGLLIGDPAFEADHVGLGLQKIDLGQEWTTMTGLPFVYAAWTGGPALRAPTTCERCRQAQAEGLGAVEAIAAEYARGDAARTARAARVSKG